MLRNRLGPFDELLADTSGRINSVALNRRSFRLFTFELLPEPDPGSLAPSPADLPPRPDPSAI